MGRVYFSSVVLLALLSACCYKKDCALIASPTIAVQFSGFTDNELEHRVIYITDNSNYKVLDSMTFYYETTPVVGLGSPLSSLDLKQQAYIIVTPVSRDTIRDINYTTVSRKISCNQCFPVGHDEQTVTTFTNFSYVFRNNTTTADTITIIK